MLSDYKKLLKLEIEINSGLISLIKECFGDLFAEESFRAKSRFDDVLNNYEDFGYMHSLDYYKEVVSEGVERTAKWKAEQAAKKGENE